MGRRINRRKFAKCQNSEEKTTPELKFFLTALEPSYSETTEDWKLAKQVKDCINEIYSEHINDLEQRKEKRLESKIPTEYFQPYNLVVNSSYQKKIKGYIQELIKIDKSKAFKEDLVSSTDIFIDCLRRHVKYFDGKKNLLQAIIIYESYHTLQNSITQVGGIVEDLVPKREFDLLLREKFNSKIASDYFDLVENVLKKENSEYLEDLLRMRKNLKNIGKTDTEDWLDYNSTLQSDSCSEEDVLAEAFHNLPIDELVKMITKEGSKKKKIRKRAILASNENSLDKDDLELENFRQRLENERPSKVKTRPMLSEEFLAQLRENLKNKGKGN